ncbi:hypothetical protein ACET3Z_003230 [Daucus carota]
MSKTLMFQRYLIRMTSSKIKACSLPNGKHRYLFSRNQILHPSNIKFKAHQNNIYVLAKAGNSDDNLQAPVPTRQHSSEWRQWVAGIVFSIVIPSCTAKIGTIVTVMKNIGNVVETLETIAEMVECTAFVVGKLADMGKKRAESNEDRPTPAEEKAKQTQELVHKEGEIGNGVGEMIECSSRDDTDNRQETGLVKRFP